jgi:hypothetical protein
MEAGMSLDNLRVLLQPAAAFGLDLLQLFERGEDAIGQWLVGKRPEPLRGLHLWRIRWQERQVDPLGQCESRTAVPAGTIQHEDDVFVWPCSSFLGKSGQGEGEDLHADGGQQQPARPPTLGMDKGKDIHPFVALGHRGLDRGSLGSPDPPQDRFEADPVLIHTPQLNAGVWMLVLHQSELVRQFF